MSDEQTTKGPGSMDRLISLLEKSGEAQEKSQAALIDALKVYAENLRGMHEKSVEAVAAVRAGSRFGLEEFEKVRAIVAPQAEVQGATLAAIEADKEVRIAETKRDAFRDAVAPALREVAQRLSFPGLAPSNSASLSDPNPLRAFIVKLSNGEQAQLAGILGSELKARLESLCAVQELDRSEAQAFVTSIAADESRWPGVVSLLGPARLMALRDLLQLGTEVG